MRASVDESKVVPENDAGQKLRLENSTQPSPGHDSPSMSPMPDTNQDTKSADPKKTEVESSLVFSGAEVAKARQRDQAASKIPDAPTTEAAKLPLTTRTEDPLPAVVVLPPEPKTNKGFLAKVKGFFGAIFH